MTVGRFLILDRWVIFRVQEIALTKLEHRSEGGSLEKAGIHLQGKPLQSTVRDRWGVRSPG